ncbi:unnamed protein product [Peronospora farinosa]|uniref:Uncharacterized protein n=1 Tax=Peronospora farinosa TaxID=134698 RepID=A0AAV0SZQ0_9STRA|nr:unnamed protein product [Peronospora farinosa]
MASLDPDRNPGCTLNEHKRRDRIFLSKEYLWRKGATASQLRQLLAAFRDSKRLFALDSSVDYGSLAKHLTFLTRLFETGTLSPHSTWPLVILNNLLVTFFRAPASAKLKLKNLSVETPKGLSKDPHPSSSQF